MMSTSMIMVALLGATVSAFVQDVCSCLDVALLYDDVEAVKDGVPDIVATAQSVSGGDLRLGAISFEDAVNVDCDLTQDINLFQRIFENGDLNLTRASDVESGSEPSSEALNFAISGVANQMCGTPPPFGEFRQGCKKLIFLLTDATKRSGACRTPSGPADWFTPPLDAANAAADSGVVISVVETNEEEGLPASSELQIYPTMTGGVFGKVTDKMTTLHLVQKFLYLLCLPPSTSGSDPASTDDPFMNGDPHVHTTDGRVIDVPLQPETWTKLLHGPSFAISGRAFSLNERGDLRSKWFDGFRVEDALSGGIIFEALLPHDVAVGSLSNRSDEVQYLNVTLGQRLCNKINVTCKSGTIAATPTKLESAARIESRNVIFNDRIDVATSDFEFDVVVAAALDPESFDSYQEMIEATHIEFKFTHIPNHHDLQGPVAELMYPNIRRERSLSAKPLARPQRPIAAI